MATSVAAQSFARARARVVLVDDHPVFREGLAAVLDREPDFEIVGQAAGVAEALELVPRVLPNLIVVDLVLRTGNGDGVELTRALRERTEARILGLSVIEEPTRIAELLHAGALGFACKTQPVTELIDALRTIASGARYVPPSLRPEVELLARAATLPYETLTPRERDVLALLLQGLTNDQIATRMFISPRTVDTHRQRVMGKLGVHSIVDLLRLAARRGELA
jgi:DNA-binding NarL/FixJ family response regulator